MVGKVLRDFLKADMRQCPRKFHKILIFNRANFTRTILLPADFFAKTTAISSHNAIKGYKRVLISYWCKFLINNWHIIAIRSGQGEKRVGQEIKIVIKTGLIIFLSYIFLCNKSWWRFSPSSRLVISTVSQSNGT